MKLRRVDPKTIKIPEVRVTARFDDEKWAQFQESIKTTGQVAPIICCDVDEELVLVDGLHRLMEAISNKVLKVDVAVVPGTMVDVLAKNIFLDHLRGKTPVSEMRQVIEALYKEYKIGIEDIQAKTGLSRDYIEKLLLISELTPMCLEALDNEEIGIGLASELMRIKDPVAQEVTLGYILANHWTISQLKAYISMYLESKQWKVEPPAPSEEKPTPTVKCRFCGEEYLPNEVASLIICQPCQGIMFEAIAIAKREAQQAAAADSTTDKVPKE